MAITLNANLLFSGMRNMIISQVVFANGVKDNNADFVNRAKVDGTLFGDQKDYFSCDALKSYPWGNDAEAQNLLKLYRPKEPSVQAIVIDTYRQIPCTVDYYLTKQFWMGEGSFNEFISVTLGWMDGTRRIYEKTLYNTFLGTHESAVGAQTDTVLLDAVGTATDTTKKDILALRALEIGQKIANISVKMGDVSREYNDYGYIREYNLGECELIMNSKYENEIKFMDLPTVFHNGGIVPTMKTLPERYFGTVGSSDIVIANVTANTYRTLIEADYATGANATVTHLFPGDFIPATSAVVTALNDNGTAKTVDAKIFKGEYYTPDSTIVCKIVGKLPPLMSGFLVNTLFVNPKSLTETHYMTFGHNTLQALKEYPFVTIRETNPVADSNG